MLMEHSISVPRLFYHVLSVHAFKHGKQFPLGYFLLPRKSGDTHNIVFLLLKESWQNFHLHLHPETVLHLSDFEKVLMQLLKLNFPSVKVKGCFYHFAQAIWRMMQNIGLVIVH